MAEHQELWLFRHGETDWSASGRHTGRTDLPLNKAGEARAKAIGKRLRGRPFALVLSSPLIRAVETCRARGRLRSGVADLRSPRVQQALGHHRHQLAVDDRVSGLLDRRARRDRRGHAQRCGHAHRHHHEHRPTASSPLSPHAPTVRIRPGGRPSHPVGPCSTSEHGARAGAPTTPPRRRAGDQRSRWQGSEAPAMAAQVLRPSSRQGAR